MRPTLPSVHDSGQRLGHTGRFGQDDAYEERFIGCFSWMRVGAVRRHSLGATRHSAVSLSQRSAGAGPSRLSESGNRRREASLGVNLDVEAAKECGGLAEQVRRVGVAEYAPNVTVESDLVACPLEYRDTVEAVVVTRRIEDAVDERMVRVNGARPALAQVVVVTAGDARVDPVQREPIVGKEREVEGLSRPGK